MSPAAVKRFRLLASVVSILLLLAGALATWFYFQLRGSLPQLDGSASLTGLSAPVSIERDALGVPTIRGATRVDVARALGFLHAQDRFFQMDTMRRRSSGQLSELVGEATIPADRMARMHGFRALADTVMARLPEADRVLLEAYADGVNAGLAALRTKPFEYLALRVDPAPWRAQDTWLVNFAMTIDLQDSRANYERSLMAVREVFGSASVAFFSPLVTPSDAALDGSVAPRVPIPDARVIDLRVRPSATSSVPRRTVAAPAEHDEAFTVGSNCFAVAGSRTATGVALVANDMHLELRVPATWYRAALEWTERAEDGSVATHRVVGATLPGAPMVVVGSNGHIAWGLTNAAVDTSDLIVVQVNSTANTLYLRGDDLVPFERRREQINVKGGKPVEAESQWTIWGPVIGTDHRQRPLALRWTAHDPDATNLHIRHLETARSVDEALVIGRGAGVPVLNLIVGGRDGRIGWTIAGRLPERFGFDGRLPTSWSYGDRGWRGLLPPDRVPTVIGGGNGATADTGGHLWSGNNRPLGGAALALLGDGAYDQPARAAQIRNDLAALQRPATAADLLAVQLDDRAVFLERWQKLLLDALSSSDAPHKSRAEFRAQIERWEGRASVESVSYRLVRAWRRAVADKVFESILAPCRENYEGFDWTKFQYEGALWQLVHEKPAHLLDPQYKSWDELLLAAVDDVVAALDAQRVPLHRATWGDRNTTRIRHPLSGAVPAWLGGWLNMPSRALPGDSNMPRVQGISFGASERYVVSPGREEEGIFHMPGGQSGHPLSRFYRASHGAWERGDPTPFLPGKTEHKLELRP